MVSSFSRSSKSPSVGVVAALAAREGDRLLETGGRGFFSEELRMEFHASGSSKPGISSGYLRTRLPVTQRMTWPAGDSLIMAAILVISKGKLPSDGTMTGKVNRRNRRVS